MKTRSLCLSLLSTAVISPAGVAQASERWQWTVEPYLMASSISGTAGIGRVAGADVDMDAGDILDKLEVGAMIRGEVLHESGWGMMADYAFMRLRDDLSLPLGGIVDAKVRQGIFEAAVFKRHPLDKGYYDLYGGIRWWDNDVDVTVNPAVLPGSAAARAEEDWVDPIIGGRYFHPVSKRWTLLLQGDIGGFSIGSDFTYSLAAGGTYQMTDAMRLTLKYKALSVDYEQGRRGTPGSFRYDAITHGPIVGVAFDF
jgi:hypothetical protein